MWRVMAVLASNGGQRQIDLAELDQHRSIDAVAAGDPPDAHGLVTRTRSANSNREVAVKLSAKGKALVARLIPIAREYETERSPVCRAEELAVLKRCLAAKCTAI